ncbi:MAG: hypothetical protein N2170_02830 [Bacteroidia bacterium]|nr:hypothetical protein [Bacteroidia bacterium]
MRTLQEGVWFARWWWRLESRRGYSLATAFLFAFLLLIVGGLGYRRQLLDPIQLRFFFWLVYFFSLFQGIPRPLLDRRSEEWRWIYSLVSEKGGLFGLWLYGLSLSSLLAFLLMGGSLLFWGYAPSVRESLFTGFAWAVPLLLTAFITKRVEASYTLTAVLVFPLCLFPLLWVTLRPEAPVLPLLILWGAESLLYFSLGPFVWRG